MRLVSQGKVQAVRSLLSFYREIRLPPKVDLDSIQTPCKGNIEEFKREFLPAFCEVLDEVIAPIRKDKSLDPKRQPKSYPLSRLGSKDWQEPLYMSLKMGPNGPSLLTHNADLAALYSCEEQLSVVKQLLSQ